MIRTAWRVAAGTAAVVAGICIATPAEAAARRTGHPVGTWTGVVSWDGGRQEVAMSFFADGTLCLVPEDDPAGGAEGSGVWRHTGGNRFSFTATERFYGPDGETLGWLTTSQKAVQTGPRFRSKGESAQYDAEWNLYYTVTSRLDMRRTGTSPTPC
ncbi:MULTISPECIES: hypothetical protein [Thermomonospora]|uniref:Lipocalin-like domain-containing protein n=1 Tax=Thermomonospora curvata (strain ATCC 19995 / DSM 43183 / JCM 3096 / KCTC 9072 / NBRC 15933 / NCIMB 10081 / Henssen B9) TaxID=471852 RepID=D1A6T6_THECD|nr:MULTISPECIES: hypothetical protein [Thermomonospora]ACY98340.1 hypothetical protein Tcur_2795 [Thermomonospora curvata DSM 43183]